MDQIRQLQIEEYYDNNNEKELNKKFDLNMFQEVYYQNLNFIFNQKNYENENKSNIKSPLQSNQIKSAYKYLLEKEKEEEEYQRKKVENANIEAKVAIKGIYDLEIERIKIIIDSMYKSGKAVSFSLASLFRVFYLQSNLIFKKIKVRFPIALLYNKNKVVRHSKSKAKTKKNPSKKYERPYKVIEKIESQDIERDERLDKIKKGQDLMRRQYRKINEDFEDFTQKKEDN